MRSLQRIVLAGALMVLAVPAFAQQVSPDEVDQRFQHQENRIDNGVKDGQLTSGQAANLTAADARKERELSRMQARDGANGQITARQDARLNGQLNHESGRIYAEKHGK
jgi:hypothetical protein